MTTKPDVVFVVEPEVVTFTDYGEQLRIEGSGQPGFWPAGRGKDASL